MYKLPSLSMAILSGFLKSRLLLPLFSKEKRKLSEIVKELPVYFLAKEKITANNIDYEKITDKIIKEFKNQKINLEDGIRIDFNDKWLLFRKSNTEPIIRIFAEAKSENEAKSLIAQVRNLL